MSSGLLDVLLDGALEILVGGRLAHLFLPFHKPALGVVELAQLVHGELLYARYGHALFDQLAKYERAKIAERSRRGKPRKAREERSYQRARPADEPMNKP